jgi:hypothetical protein
MPQLSAHPLGGANSMKKYFYSILCLVLFSSCGIKKFIYGDEEGFRNALNHFYGFDKCSNLANVECLRTVGWTFEQVTLVGVKDSLDMNVKLDTIVTNDSTTMKIRRRFRMAAIEYTESIHQGDELFFFSSPPATWKELCGRQGYLIRHRDSLVTSITTLLN